MQIAIRAIGLVSMVILARLLVPADFGLVALAMMVYGLLEVFGQFGFDVVLIQNQTADRRHYDTAWTLTIIRNTVMAGLLVVGAPLATGFFDEPRLQGILYWLAAAAFIEGFANIGVVNFRKDLEFHKDFIYMLGAKLGAFVVTVPLAFAWQNYWALVAGIVSAAIVRVLLGYHMSTYRPRPSLATWREIMNFSKWLLSNNLLHFIYMRADQFVIGKLSSAQALGLYSIAHEISNLATTELAAPIRRALYPGYAKVSGSRAALRQSFADTLSLIILAALPIAVGAGLVADSLVLVLLGERWIDAVPIVQILAAYGAISVCSANIWPVYIALRRPDIFSLSLGCGIAAMIPLLIWATDKAGVIGAAWAVTFAASVVTLVNFYAITRLLGLSPRIVFLGFWRPLISTLVMALLLISLQDSWLSADTFIASLQQLVSKVGVGGMTYVLVSFALWHLCGSPRGAEMHVIDFLLSRCGAR